MYLRRGLARGLGKSSAAAADCPSPQAGCGGRPDPSSAATLQPQPPPLTKAHHFTTANFFNTTRAAGVGTVSIGYSDCAGKPKRVTVGDCLSVRDDFKHKVILFGSKIKLSL